MLQTVPEQLRLLELFPGIFLVVVGQDGEGSCEKDKLKESERYRQEWRLKAMLDFGQKTEVTGYNIDINIAETETTENIARYGRLHSDQFLLNCSDDLRMNPPIF